MTGRRGRIGKQLLDGLKDKRRYWKLKEEALDCTLWRTRFGRGCGPVVRQDEWWFQLTAYGNFASFLQITCNESRRPEGGFSWQWEFTVYLKFPYKSKTKVFKLPTNTTAVYKVKVKVTLVQARRLCTGSTAHRGSRGIALLRLCTGRTAHRGSRGVAILRLCTGRTAHRGSRGIAILRLCTGRTAHRGSTGIALLFHDQRH